MANAQILRCYVWLVDSDPPIWRRFQMSDQITLDALHTVLQRVMGWQTLQRYRFEVHGDRYTQASLMPLEDSLDSTSQHLADFQFQPRATFTYTYDFKDGWLHQITVEDVLPAAEGIPHLTCLDGKRACPPEGSDGVWGYEDLLERLNDPEDPDYEALLDRIGFDFDPEAFDVEAVNQSLCELK